MTISKTAIIIILLSCCYSCKNSAGNKTNTKIEVKQEVKQEITKIANKLNMVTYKNNEIGLVYALPNNFIQKHDPIRAIDLQGNLKKIETTYSDSLTQSSIIFKFYPQKSGENMYNLKKDLFTNTIKIANTKGIIRKEKINKNGKGNELSTPVELSKIDFYKENKAYIQILIKTNQQDSVLAKQILDKIEFIN